MEMQWVGKPGWALLVALALPACGGDSGGGGGRSPVSWEHLIFCEAAMAWTIDGFRGRPGDGDRDPSDPRVAVIRVGQTVELNVENLWPQCLGSVSSVRWVSSNPGAAGLQPTSAWWRASLRGVAVGETLVSAALQTPSGSILTVQPVFFDGTTITSIRVVAP